MPEQIMFVHGLGLSGKIWDRLARLDLGAHILTPDLPGHGSAPRGRYDFASLWGYLESKLAPQSWRQTILVLHSMAGALLPYLIGSGIRPQGIVLIEGNLIGCDAMWSRQICSYDPSAYRIWLERVRRTASMVLKSQLKTRHNAEDLSRWSDGFTRVDAVALRVIAEQLVASSIRRDSVHALERLCIKSCYLRGALSDDWEEGRLLPGKIGVPILDIPRSGHYPMIDNPEETWKAINSLN